MFIFFVRFKISLKQTKHQSHSIKAFESSRGEPQAQSQDCLLLSQNTSVSKLEEWLFMMVGCWVELKASLHHRVCARELAGASSADGGGNTGFASSFAASHPRLAWACQPPWQTVQITASSVFPIFQTYTAPDSQQRHLSPLVFPASQEISPPSSTSIDAETPWREISRQILNQTKSTRISS